MTASGQSSAPAACSSASSSSCSRCYTPACCQSRSRRQHVIPDPDPSSGGERRILRFPASLADLAPVSLGEAITGIDDRNVGLLVKAVRRAPGRRQFG